MESHRVKTLTFAADYPGWPVSSRYAARPWRSRQFNLGEPSILQIRRNCLGKDAGREVFNLPFYNSPLEYALTQLNCYPC